MPPRKNSPLRILVPAALAIGAIGLAIAVATNTTNSSQSNAPAPDARPAEAGAERSAQDAATQGIEAPLAAGDPGTEPPTDSDAAGGQSEANRAAPAARVAGGEQAADQPVPANAALVGLSVQSFDAPAAPPSPLGSLDPNGSIKLLVEFDQRTSGVSSLRLADAFTSADAERRVRAGEAIAVEDHVQVQKTLTHNDAYLSPLGASSITLAGQTLYLDYPQAGQSFWRELSPGQFAATIVNADGDEVVRVVRTYSLDPDSHNLTLEQRIENLTAAPLQAQLVTTGLTDQTKDTLGYGGDKRRVRFGYLASQAIDPARTEVSAGSYLLPRRSEFGEREADGSYQPVRTIWPRPKGEEAEHELVWAGVTSRYYAAIIHKDLPDSIDLSDPKTPSIDRVFHDVEQIQRVLINRPVPKAGLFGTSVDNDPLMALSIVARPLRVEANASASQTWGVYAGPSSKPAIRAEAELAALGLDEVVVFNFGGPCAACTFSWLTKPMLGLLRILHGFTTDWSFSIILLVVCVRTILHPVTRWSQIRMQRFGKQMQLMAPKQKKLQERYKDDPTKMREEMGKLWREEGVSPAGFLGCLPMFLQSPVWIALYATLYFAFDLRHEPAFFGAFQSLTGGSWAFMSDLSEPDQAIPLGGGFAVPLMGTIASINILPLLLGVVFYVHQKYLTPPASAAMTPEQESQQKMIRFLSVFMFPIFMYNAPCGLALYFITNSTLAIVENRWIRAHMDKHNMLDPEHLKSKPKGPPKPGTLRHRIATMVAEQQKLREEQDRRSPKREPRMAKPDTPERRYKKRR